MARPRAQRATPSSRRWSRVGRPLEREGARSEDGEEHYGSKGRSQRRASSCGRIRPSRVISRLQRLATSYRSARPGTGFARSKRSSRGLCLREVPVFARSLAPLVRPVATLVRPAPLTVFAAVHPESRPERVAGRPEQVRHGLIDHGDERSTVAVGRARTHRRVGAECAASRSSRRRRCATRRSRSLGSRALAIPGDFGCPTRSRLRP